RVRRGARRPTLQLPDVRQCNPELAMNSTIEISDKLALRPLTPKLGAALTDVKLADDMSDELFRAIYQAFLRYQVLLFPPQDVPPARQVAFARRFGEVQIHIMNQYHADGFPALYRLWHLG